MLSTWLAEQGYGSMARLARAAGVSHMTIWFHVRRGYALSYDVAKKIHAATDGAISIETLCEGDPIEAAKWPRKKKRAADGGAEASK
jgi:AcrR family transcriptional regulator